MYTPSNPSEDEVYATQYCSLEDSVVTHASFPSDSGALVFTDQGALLGMHIADNCCVPVWKIPLGIRLEGSPCPICGPISDDPYRSHQRPECVHVRTEPGADTPWPVLFGKKNTLTWAGAYQQARPLSMTLIRSAKHPLEDRQKSRSVSEEWRRHLEREAPPEPAPPYVSCASIMDAIDPTRVPALNSVYAKERETFTEEGARVNRIILQALTRSLYHVYAVFPVPISVESVLGPPANNVGAYEAEGGVARLLVAWNAQRRRCIEDASEKYTKKKVKALKDHLTSKDIAFGSKAKKADLVGLCAQAYLTIGDEAFDPSDGPALERALAPEG